MSTYAPPTVDAPAIGSIAITPSNSTVFSPTIRKITVTVGGVVAWVNANGETQITGELLAGDYPMLASQILETGTTATVTTGWL